MPLFNKPNKPDPFKKPDSKIPLFKKPLQKIQGQGESFFEEGHQISRYKIDRSLRKNINTRNYLKRQLGLKSQKEVDEEISKLEGRIPKRFGGFIDSAEAKKLITEEYWNAKHDMQKNPKDFKEIKKREKEYKFLKNKFRIK